MSQLKNLIHLRSFLSNCSIFFYLSITYLSNREIDTISMGKLNELDLKNEQKLEILCKAILQKMDLK